jgi:hypothetical protein
MNAKFIDEDKEFYDRKVEKKGVDFFFKYLITRHLILNVC